MRKPKRILVAGDDLAIREATNGDVVVAMMESRGWGAKMMSVRGAKQVQRDHAALARVMAAAPEMLAILKSCERHQSAVRNNIRLHNRVLAVIRKAEGK